MGGRSSTHHHHHAPPPPSLEERRKNAEAKFQGTNAIWQQQRNLLEQQQKVTQEESKRCLEDLNIFQAKVFSAINQQTAESEQQIQAFNAEIQVRLVELNQKKAEVLNKKAQSDQKVVELREQLAKSQQQLSVTKESMDEQFNEKKKDLENLQHKSKALRTELDKSIEDFGVANVANNASISAMATLLSNLEQIPRLALNNMGTCTKLKNLIMSKLALFHNYILDCRSELGKPGRWMSIEDSEKWIQQQKLDKYFTHLDPEFRSMDVLLNGFSDKEFEVIIYEGMTKAGQLLVKRRLSQVMKGEPTIIPGITIAVESFKQPLVPLLTWKKSAEDLASQQRKLEFEKRALTN